MGCVCVGGGEMKTVSLWLKTLPDAIFFLLFFSEDVPTGIPGGEGGGRLTIPNATLSPPQ